MLFPSGVALHVIYALLVITPELKNRARAIEIIDRLQNHVAPHVFQPPAIYDGRANLFSSHRLALSNGNSGNVRNFIEFLLFVLMVLLVLSLQYNVGKYNIKLVLSAAQKIDFSYVPHILTIGLIEREILCSGS